MKHLQIIVLSVAAIGLLAGAADAQRKSTTKKSSTRATKSVLPPLDVRAAREKVSNQLDNINRFVDILGLSPRASKRWTSPPGPDGLLRRQMTATRKTSRR
jgi:hypothetical protein